MVCAVFWQKQTKINQEKDIIKNDKIITLVIWAHNQKPPNKWEEKGTQSEKCQKKDTKYESQIFQTFKLSDIEQKIYV